MQLINRTIISLIMITLVSPALAKSPKVSDDLNSLGVNRDLVKKAKKIRPGNKIKIVQKRAVDRHWRLEGSLGYGAIAGGNPYLDSRQLGFNLDLHITPRWSVGANHYRFDNDLSSEGSRFYDAGSQNGLVPDLRDFPENATIGHISWYPIYGKINLFNWNVTQFDIYLTAGYGQIQLAESGATDLLTAGGGVGFWLTNWLSTRFEVRYQTYEDTVNDVQKRTLEQTVFAAKVGFIL